MRDSVDSLGLARTLVDYGYSPRDIDFLFFTFERPGD